MRGSYAAPQHVAWLLYSPAARWLAILACTLNAFALLVDAGTLLYLTLNPAPVLGILLMPLFLVALPMQVLVIVVGGMRIAALSGSPRRLVLRTSYFDEFFYSLFGPRPPWWLPVVLVGGLVLAGVGVSHFGDLAALHPVPDRCAVGSDGPDSTGCFYENGAAGMQAMLSGFALFTVLHLTVLVGLIREQNAVRRAS